MSLFALPFAVLYGLVLAGLAASLLAVFCAHRLVRTAEDCARQQEERAEAAIGSLRKQLAECVSQLQDARREPAMSVVSSPLRPGLNLSKRSQALRMHRRGDAPEQIATSLSIPLQEVDLLLKVHGIFVGAL